MRALSVLPMMAALLVACLMIVGCQSQQRQSAGTTQGQPYPESQTLYKNPNPQIEKLHLQAYNLDIGNGVPRNQTLANELYLKAALAGDARSMFNLSLNLMYGDGIVKDEMESYAWADLARFHTRKSPDMNMKWRIRAFCDEANKTLSPDQIQRGKQRAKTLQAMMTPGQLN